MKPPKPVSGTSAQASWLNQLLAFCISLQLRSGRNYNLLRSPQGVALDLPEGGRGGISKGGGMNYRGDYDPAETYAVNDVVRVRSAPYPMGVWICVKAVPTGDPPVFTPPTFPEPHDTDNTKVNTWELLALGVQQFNACQGSQQKTVYINMLQQ